MVGIFLSSIIGSTRNLDPAGDFLYRTEKGTRMLIYQTMKTAVMIILTYGAMGMLGFQRARKFTPPSPWRRWAWLILGALLGPSLIEIGSISIFGWELWFGWILHGYILGLLAGLCVRELRARRGLA